MRLASPVAAAMCLALLAGCGSDDQLATTNSADSTPAATELPATSPAGDDAAEARPGATPSPTPRAKNEIPEEGSQDFGAAPAARGDDTERVPADDGLTLTAPNGARASWLLTAKTDDDAFCVKITTRSVADPDPLCHSGTQLALSFFSDQAEAHALADVDVVAPSGSERATEIVVAGVAAPDVKRVDATYAGKRYSGEVTRHSVRLPVDKQLAKDILDPTPEQLRSLPETITVRAFAITIPIAKAAPPTRATATSPIPVKGRMTFELS